MVHVAVNKYDFEKNQHFRVRFWGGGGGHQKAYAVYAFINVDNCERPLNDTPKRVKDKINKHSLKGFINYGKNDMIHKYSNICIIQHCYICQQSQLHL